MNLYRALLPVSFGLAVGPAFLGATAVLSYYPSLESSLESGVLEADYMATKTAITGLGALAGLALYAIPTTVGMNYLKRRFELTGEEMERGRKS